ncbi:AAA family ATPase [Streptomyces griseorubiginosus]|uniref:AAA family ATPase n=1 Tax=Streptomyces griseorubiginosus TaxID=67304 RepID=UPI0036B4DA2A
MLTLDRLIVQNFGPYRGQQEMRFTQDRGVYIIYGPNGRGKTTLHNAFRYALYGQIYGRRGMEHARELANRDVRRQEGYGSFETVLEFHHDETPYRLIRRYDERETPSEILLLERDGTPMSQDDSKKALQGIAPESVSQFFLFDGELLRKYEDLLDKDSEDGAALEKSIERVLGLPIVDNARTDVAALRQAVGKQLTAQYAAHAETRRMALSLNEAQEVRDRMQSGYDEIDSRINAGKGRIAELDALLREHAKGERLLGSLEALTAQLRENERREQEATEALSNLSHNLWKAILARSANERLIAVDAEVAALEGEMRNAAASVRDLAHLREGSDCPVCRRDIPEALRGEISQSLESQASISHHEDIDTRLNQARGQRKTLQTLALENADLVVERDRNLRRIRLELGECRDEITATERQLKDFGEEKLRALSVERGELAAKIVRDESHLETARTELNDQELVIEDFKRKLRRQAVQPDHTLDLKDQVGKSLVGLFADSIDSYRAKLRRRVEEHASEIFRGLTSEPDYQGLRITDRYGLEIIDADNEVVRRSAGYEHLVALSLIAALQDSAAVRGPVIMDYPFGRLDADNTSHVVAGLPRMARQVILLSFDGEFDRPAALQALGSNLVAEYELERVSSKHTLIQPRRTI